jgi:hypothetical protein
MAFQYHCAESKQRRGISHGEGCCTSMKSAMLGDRFWKFWKQQSPSPQLDVQSANRSGRVAEGLINPLIPREARRKVSKK